MDGEGNTVDGFLVIEALVKVSYYQKLLSHNLTP
jgi:hypothetical protein